MPIVTKSTIHSPLKNRVLSHTNPGHQTRENQCTEAWADGHTCYTHICHTAAAPTTEQAATTETLIEHPQTAQLDEALENTTSAITTPASIKSHSIPSFAQPPQCTCTSGSRNSRSSSAPARSGPWPRTPQHRAPAQAPLPAPRGHAASTAPAPVQPGTAPPSHCRPRRPPTTPPRRPRPCRPRQPAPQTPRSSLRPPARCRMRCRSPRCH